MSVYLDLTREFNSGRIRAVLSSGQAVVMHRLAVTSKDGDWIVRDDDEAIAHVLIVLASHGARYRFGAPLDLRWLQHGWSSHLEFRPKDLRVRTDFVTRPPRLPPTALDQLWHAATDVPFLGLLDLVKIKMTDRERDWPIVGELARRLLEPGDQLLYSRSARDLMELARTHPALLDSARGSRPTLAAIHDGREALEAALDAERRALMRANEARLAGYEHAAESWAKAWPDVERQVSNLSLPDAHAVIVERAQTLLPFDPGSSRMTRGRREEFLSEEDLDLANVSETELFAWWDLWLHLAQASNPLDEDEYSHGVFRRAPRRTTED